MTVFSEAFCSEEYLKRAHHSVRARNEMLKDSMRHALPGAVSAGSRSFTAHLCHVGSGLFDMRCSLWMRLFTWD